MASTDLNGTMDMRDVLKHHVILTLKVKGANWALQRLLATMWFLRFLAWLGGVKEVIFEGEYDGSDEPANAPMERDITEWKQQGRPRVFDDL